MYFLHSIKGFAFTFFVFGLGAYINALNAINKNNGADGKNEATMLGGIVGILSLGTVGYLYGSTLIKTTCIFIGTSFLGLA